MKNILISDISLKNTKSGVALSFKEKLDIAKRLSELGVDAIELPQALDKSDEVLFKTISACINKTTICVDAGKTENSLEKNYSLISLAKKKRILISVPVSPVQMEYSASKKPTAVLDWLNSMVKKAVSLTEEVEVSLEDATRAENEFLTKAINTAIDGGAKYITISDLAGDIISEEFGEFVKNVFNSVNLKTAKLYVKCSDEFSFATSSIISSIINGASGIKLCATNEGSLANFEKVISAIDYVGGKKGFSTNVNRTAIKRILERVNGVSSSNADQNVEEKEQLISLSLTDFSKVVKKRGYDLSSEETKKIYSEYLRLSEKKIVNTKELDVLVATYSLQVPETYSLVSFSVNTSNILSATASIVLNKNGETVKGLSYGNGAVDAAFLALENITGRHFELDDFVLGSVTEGKEAMGQAVVKLRFNGQIYSGRGVSTDIVGASIRAYINAINKIVYEENA
ncbi:MAG: hypothetical protein MJ066_04485 [Clostridia bacterium]|nr:hypothetical protein [Clostridia bacterium]